MRFVRKRLFRAALPVMALGVSVLAPPARAGDADLGRYSAEEAKFPFVGRDSELYFAPIFTGGKIDPKVDACKAIPAAIGERVSALKRDLEITQDPLGKAELAAQLAAILSGSPAGLTDSEDFLSRAIAWAKPVDRKRAGMFTGFRGLVRLRLAENANCLANHNADSCIFPLSKAAVHTDKAWAEKAITDFSAYLSVDPGSLHAKWLLNVAYMAVGAYPRGVPKKFLVPIAGTKAPSAFKKFVDVGGPAGIQKTRVGAGGAMIEDLDGDGLLDIVLAPRLPCQGLVVYQNNGDGTFTPPLDTGLSNELWVTNVIQADFNNDGKTDLYLSRGAWFEHILPDVKSQNSLLENHGGWKFENVTEKAGLIGEKSLNVSANWVDFDLDGWVDLFVCNENRPPDLFKNNGDGTFTNVAEKMGITNSGVCKGSAWADIDGDGYPDLVISNYGSENRIFRNEGGVRFREVKVPAVNHLPTLSFSAFFFDYDNDGKPDLFLGAFNRDVEPFLRYFLGEKSAKTYDTSRIFHNVSVPGEIKFEDVSERMHMNVPAMAMGSNVGDVDNDGYPDIFTGTGSLSLGDLVPDQMFWNRGGKAFEEVTYAGGFGNLQKGHGVAFGDLENNGNQDILVSHGGATSGDGYFASLYRNPGFGNDWLELKLEGTTSNRSAIGAKIAVKVKSGGVIRTIYNTVGQTSSFGTNPLLAHFGLGKAAEVLEIRVAWPNKKQTVSTFPNPGKNKFLSLKEGAASPVLIPTKVVRLRSREPRGHVHHGP